MDTEQTVKVLVSWSKAESESHKIAKALKTAISGVFKETVTPFVHDKESQIGLRWDPELDKTLKDTRLVILCITKENCQSAWLAYEAGVCYGKNGGRAFPLLCNLGEKTLEGPFKDFNCFAADRKGIKTLFIALNNEIGRASQNALTPGKLTMRFEKHWKTLQKILLTSGREDPGTWMVTSDEASKILEDALSNKPILQAWKLVCKSAAHPIDACNFTAASHRTPFSQLPKVRRGSGVDYALIRGPLGIGKSVLLYRYLSSEASGMSNCKRIVDMVRLMENEKPEFEIIRSRVMAGIRGLVKTQPALVICDGIDVAARRIAGRTNRSAKDILYVAVKAALSAVHETIKGGTARIIFSADDRSDGSHLPIVDDLEKFIGGLVNRARFATFELELAEVEPVKWEPVLQTKGGTEIPRLAVFIDACLNAPQGGFTHGKLMEALKEHSSNIRKYGLPHQALYEMSGEVEQWVDALLRLGRDDDSIETCVASILNEQTWEWLFLLRLAYSGNNAVISQAWRLHERLRRGEYRNSKALSNVISFLTFLDVYGKNDDPFPKDDPYTYIHCNLQGVLLPKRLDGATFLSTNLTGAVLSPDAEFSRSTFIACLFDKDTSQLLREKAEGFKPDNNYVEVPGEAPASNVKGRSVRVSVASRHRGIRKSWEKQDPGR